MARAGEPSPQDAAQAPALESVLEFLSLLWNVDHGLKSMSRVLESSLGLTGPQRLVVRIVGRFPGTTSGRLAQILHVHPSTLTGIMKRLEERGLIERKPDPDDARKALLFLTQAGRGLDVPAAGTIEDAVQRVLSRMPKARLAAAQDVLTALAEELGTRNEPL